MDSKKLVQEMESGPTSDEVSGSSENEDPTSSSPTAFPGTFAQRSSFLIEDILFQRPKVIHSHPIELDSNESEKKFVWSRNFFRHSNPMKSK